MILKRLAGIEIIREKLLPYLKDKNLTEEQRYKILKVISILDDILYSDDIQLKYRIQNKKELTKKFLKKQRRFFLEKSNNIIILKLGLLY